MKNDSIYTVSEIAPGAYFINESDVASIYLITGETRALLIDTGAGLGDLKQVVASITDLPYDVAMTHGHVDHVGGRGPFPAIWIHPDDDKMVKEVTPTARKAFLLTQVWGAGGKRDLMRRIRPGEQEPKRIPMEDGHVFDLGGKTVRVIHAPGHTRGSVYFYDAADGLIFTGDNTAPLVLMCMPNAATLEEYIQSLELLLALRDGYHAIYSGHDCMPVPLTRVTCMLKNAKEALQKSQNSLLPGIRIRQINNCPLVYRTRGTGGQA